MRHDEQVRVIRGLIDHLDHDTNVDAGGILRNPVSSYVCPDIATREWQEFFQHYPQVLGMSGDLPEPGTFFTNADLGKPILCTRDKTGEFHAFLNVCRHRGTVLEQEERGKRSMFSCPFHAWGYSNRGELVAIPKAHHFGEVDRACMGLVALPAEERHGLLWVHPDPQGTLDIAACLGAELDQELASWHLERFQYKSCVTYPHAMNWKLAVDTFGETYHFNVLHKNTLANDFYGNAQMYDTYGRNHRMMLCMKSIDGLRNLPESEWDVLKGTLPVYYLFPNVQLILGMAGPSLVRIYPDGENPHQSHSQVSFYLHPELDTLDLDPEQRARVEEVEERMVAFAEIIEQEDYVAAASSHVGIVSGAQEHLTFGRNEPALHHYHNTYRDVLGLPRLELEVPA